MFSGYFLKVIFYKTHLFFINSNFELDILEDEFIKTIKSISQVKSISQSYEKENWGSKFKMEMNMVFQLA